MSVFHDTKQSEEQKRSSLSNIFQEAVDTDWIGKFVLGKFWRSASAAEQAEYLKDYRAYLTKTYVSKFNDDDGLNVEDIALSPLTKQGDDYLAKTIIKRKNDEDVHVDYTLAQAGAKCQVHDIIIEGVSLLTSERSEFGSVASSGGVKNVITELQKQLAAGDAAK